MDTIVTGNAAIDPETRNRQGWFVGHFLPPTDLRHSTDVEIKWGIHPAGQRNSAGFVANRTSRTMSILIQGRFRLSFRAQIDSPPRTIILAQPGDYVLWDKAVQHDWEALADSIIFSVRWPSLPADQG